MKSLLKVTQLLNDQDWNSNPEGSVCNSFFFFPSPLPIILPISIRHGLDSSKTWAEREMLDAPYYL